MATEPDTGALQAAIDAAELAYEDILFPPVGWVAEHQRGLAAAVRAAETHIAAPIAAERDEALARLKDLSMVVRIDDGAIARLATAERERDHWKTLAEVRGRAWATAEREALLRAAFAVAAMIAEPPLSEWGKGYRDAVHAIHRDLQRRAAAVGTEETT